MKEDNTNKGITQDAVDGINIKYIENTNENFAISRNGECYSFTYKMNGKRIGAAGPGGYLTVSIQYNDGKRKTEYIHRLVANAFVPNPEGKKHVVHINGERQDNRAENLCWLSAKENCNLDSHSDNLSAAIREYYKKRNKVGRYPKRVAVMRKSGEILYIAPTIQAASYFISYRTGKSEKSNAMQISMILNERKSFKSVGGFFVREATEDEYQNWQADWKTLHREEVIELTNVPLNKASKEDGVKMVNRRMNPLTGEVEIEETEFNKGDKITNELK